MSTVDTTPARPGRFQEIWLLILALSIPLCAWILITSNISAEGKLTLPQMFLPITIAAIVLVFGAHVMIRTCAPWADPILFPTAVALNGLGLAMIHRIDYSLIEQGDHAEVPNQLILSGGGIVLMMAAIGIIKDHRRLRKFTYISLILGITLLILPLTPGLGVNAYGARLWINVFGFSFQPAELAKICFAVFFSGYLVSQRDNLALAGPKILGIQFPQLRHFAPIFLAWGICLGILAFENDFGTALLFFSLFVAMLYVATQRISWIIIGLLLSTGGIAFIIKVAPHVQNRITIWLHALDPVIYDRSPGSYQLVQGLFGMANGGLFGTGWAEGYPANAFAANSDFIIPSLGEELGLTGVLAILCLFLLFVERAISTGLHLNDGFGKLLATGLGFTIAIQCFVVVGGISRVIPLTGLAMPFMALGGSALLTNWIIVGILLRMSDDARRPALDSPIPISMIDTGELSKILGDDSIEDTQLTDRKDHDDNDSHPTQVVHL